MPNISYIKMLLALPKHAVHKMFQYLFVLTLFLYENGAIPPNIVPSDSDTFCSKHKVQELFRILGGHPTKIQDRPYQVAINHSCGGSIIDDQWVLTAAHCTKNKTEADLKVRVGSHFQKYCGEVLNVSKIIVHPNYNSTTKEHDLSLLKLSRKVTLGKPIPLIDTPVPPGSKVTVSGWGVYNKNGKRPEVLQTVELTVLNSEECFNLYHKQHPNVSKEICLGTDKGEKGPCHGDSGGPIVFNEKLAGVESFGGNCKNVNRGPDVAINVYLEREWILKTMASN